MALSLKLTTIGVYGWDEASFFAALQAARVDTLCDIRRRRGVRGREYAFANSERLQGRLKELGIRYIHWLALSPPEAVRQRQHEADRAANVARRKRAELDPAFVAAYEQSVLAHLQPDSLLAELGLEPKVIALFCVEREPAACHRSLLAAALSQEWGVEVAHLLP
jgi:uncharacterized protein (DUF488 family)